MPRTLDKLLSRRDVATLLDVSMKTIDRWTQERFIPHLKVKGRVFYSKKKILKWLEDFEIAGKDWKTEYKNMFLIISKAEAKRRFERKKKLRKLYLKLKELYKGEEEKDIRKWRKRRGANEETELKIKKVSRVGNEIRNLLREEYLSIVQETIWVEGCCVLSRRKTGGGVDVWKARYSSKPESQKKVSREEMIERGLIGGLSTDDSLGR